MKNKKNFFIPTYIYPEVKKKNPEIHLKVYKNFITQEKFKRYGWIIYIYVNKNAKNDGFKGFTGGYVRK